MSSSALVFFFGGVLFFYLVFLFALVVCLCACALVRVPPLTPRSYQRVQAERRAKELALKTRRDNAALLTKAQSSDAFEDLSVRQLKVRGRIVSITCTCAVIFILFCLFSRFSRLLYIASLPWCMPGILPYAQGSDLS